MGMNLGKLQEMVRDKEAWHAAVNGVVKNWTQLGSWRKSLCIYMHMKLILFLQRTLTSKNGKYPDFGWITKTLF